MEDLIPPEITVNILFRLSVNDLVRCRRVSKQWLSVIDDPQFIRTNLHRTLSTNSNSVIFRQQRTSEPRVLYSRDDISSINGSFSNPIQCGSSPMSLMGSCHGLACFSLCDDPHDFVILNPSTGERHTLGISSITEGRFSDHNTVTAHGFGYDESSDDYKVVRIFCKAPYRYRSLDYIAEIYGVRSKGFLSTISFSTDFSGTSNRRSVGVFFGSSLHWYTPLDRQWGNPLPPRGVIHAIDLVSNTYRQLQLPDFDQTVDFLNMGIVDSRMCLCGFLNVGKKFGIWVMEEYGNPESWSRIYSFQNVVDPLRPFAVNPKPYAVTPLGNNGNKILLMVNWRNFVWYDPTKKNAYDETDETVCLTTDTKKPSRLHNAIYCVESLVKIFPNDWKKKDAYDQ